MFTQTKETKLSTLFSKTTLVMAAALLTSVGCGSKNMSFDLLSESANFSQSAAEVNGKIDILFVIDNSGSMATSQQALASNFHRFIEKFQANGFDFRMAVTTSDAYKDDFNASLNMAVFANGTYTNTAGQVVAAPKIMTPTTPELEKAFIANILRGVNGSGDERVFQSMKAALVKPQNVAMDFPRADAYLSVIMLSDEDDFSWGGTSTIEMQYTNPAMYTVQSYVDFLDTLTGSTATNRHYNVNSIGVLDSACITALGNGGQKIATRQNALATATGGLVSSICADFGTTLSSISNKIIELSTQFYLDRVPSDGTLRVFVSGIEVLLNTTNGYSYNATNNSITFHGTAVPPAGAAISVTYTPTELR